MIGQVKEGVSLWSSRVKRRLRPSRDNIRRLARRYLEKGNLDESARVLEEGMRKYPGLSELEDVAHFVAQLKLRQQELSTQKVLSSARQAYYKLAQAHISVGDRKVATETIWAGLQRFPDCAPLYRCLGELHLRLFLQDYLTHDGTVAADNLERTLGLDETDVQATTYLAALYFRIGSYNRSAKHLGNLLDRMSSGEERYIFIEKLLVQCNHRGDDGKDRPLAEYLNAVYENHAFVNDLQEWGWPESPKLTNRDVSLMEVKPGLLRKTIVDFLPKSKASGAVVLTRSEDVVIGDVPFEHTTETLSGILTGLTDAGAESCHRMELGHLSRTMVQLSEGSLGSMRLRSAQVVFLFGPGHAAKSVSQTLDSFTDCLALAIGENGEVDTRETEPKRGD